MADPTREELVAQLVAAAAGPQSATSDGQQVNAFSLSERLEYLRYWDQQQAAAKKSRGLRITKLVPPGSV